MASALPRLIRGESRPVYVISSFLALLGRWQPETGLRSEKKRVGLSMLWKNVKPFEVESSPIG